MKMQKKGLKMPIFYENVGKSLDESKILGTMESS